MIKTVENAKISEELKNRIDTIINDIRKFADASPEELEENRNLIIVHTCCTLCQILHGYINKKISREDTINLLSLFIVNPNRINRLLLLAANKDKCHYKYIKEAIELDLSDDCISDIIVSSHKETDDEQYCAPTVNRCIISSKSKDVMNDIIDLRKNCNLEDVDSMPIESKERFCKIKDNLTDIIDPDGKRKQKPEWINNHNHHHDVHDCKCHEHKVADTKIDKAIQSPGMSPEDFVKKFSTPEVLKSYSENKPLQTVEDLTHFKPFNSPEVMIKRAVDYLNGGQQPPVSVPINPLDGIVVANNESINGADIIKKAMDKKVETRQLVRTYVDFGDLDEDSKTRIVDMIVDNYKGFEIFRNKDMSVDKYHVNYKDGMFSIYYISKLDGKRYDLIFTNNGYRIVCENDINLNNISMPEQMLKDYSAIGKI